MRKIVFSAATLGVVALSGCGTSGQIQPSGSPAHGGEIVEGASRTPSPADVDDISDTTCAHYHRMRTRTDLLDEVIALFDQAVSARDSRATTKTDETLAGRAKKGEARHLLLEAILDVLADQMIPDEQVGALLRGRIGMQTLHDASAAAWPELPRDHYSIAVAELRAERDIPNEILTHISPAHSEDINFFGIITVDVEAELAKLDSHGRRPLRSR